MLSDVGTLALHELRMTIRGRAGLTVMIGACLLAFVDAALRAKSPLVAGVRASTFGCGMVLVPLSLIFAAESARRDDTMSAGEVVHSRPYPGQVLLLARFLGNYGVAVTAYALVIVCSLLAPLLLVGRVASPSTFVHALCRGLVPLLFVVAVGFCGVSLARNGLAAMVVAVYWMFVLIWGDFLARIFNFTLTQNWPTYAALALSVVLGTAAFYQCREGAGARRRPRGGLAASAAALLVFGVLNARQRVAHSHDKPLRVDPFAMQIAAQHRDACPRAPGFWLPDQHGKPWRLSETNGKVLVLAFWSPHVPESIGVLESVAAVRNGFPVGRVACVAVCLADDHALSRQVAAEGRFQFPMVTDPGTHYDDDTEEYAPVAEAFQLTQLPTVLVTDAGRRIVADLGETASLDSGSIIAAVRQAQTIPVPPGVGVERS